MLLHAPDPLQPAAPNLPTKARASSTEPAPAVGTERFVSAVLGALALGCGLGILHAFDADHIAAVSSLAGRESNKRRGLTYAAKWAFGHGATLFSLGALAVLVGWDLPPTILHSAERLVGLVLVLTGLSVLVSLYRRRVELRPHRHGDVTHVHLTLPGPASERHDHTPVLVGVLHGLAGSGPALAMIPLTLYTPRTALAYLFVFSLGVFAGMITFGLLFERLQDWLTRCGAQVYAAGQILLGMGTTALGSVWLFTG